MQLKIGYSPLNDAALIILAEALGFYETEGLNVILSREANWSNIRDKLAYGLIDAAHLLAPMPFASALGLGSSMGRIITPMALGANGNSFIISKELKARFNLMKSTQPKVQTKNLLMESARYMMREVDRRRTEGERRLIFAVPFTWSPHHFVLRHWAIAAGLDPDRQLQWMVLPPSRMAGMLKDGLIDGFCSGAPWPLAAQKLGCGDILFSDPDYWSLKPEKILGVREEWAENNPESCLTLCRSLMRASLWASEVRNRDDLARILSRRIYVDASQETIKSAFENNYGGWKLDALQVTFPWLSHAKWFIGQISSLNISTKVCDFDQLARNIYRPDIWCDAARSLGLDCPIIFEKIEGAQYYGWEIPAKPKNITMPDNLFFDGGMFITRSQRSDALELYE